MVTEDKRDKKDATIKTLYVTVDACADLGGKPYKVLEELKKLYAITHRRKLRYIDSEQGFHEKSDCTIPPFIPFLERKLNNYAQFIQDNPNWTIIARTPLCKNFVSELSKNIIPTVVFPLLDAAERISTTIQHEAYKIMQQEGKEEIGGKRISAATDIPVIIEKNYNQNYSLTDSILNRAADKALSTWQNKMHYIKGYDGRNKAKGHKGFMLKMIKAMQELKACSCVLEEFSQHATKQEREYHLPKLSELSQNSHYFASRTLSKTIDFWQHNESIQALRLTELWPWKLKNMLSETTANMLKQSHKNTADKSYLYLLSNILPEQSNTLQTLYILVTHDGPLIKQCLEVSTGIALHGDEEFKDSTIHKRLNLAKRPLDGYPRQLALTGGEFCNFIYRELLAAISPYIASEERSYLSQAIRTHTPKNDQEIYAKFKASIDVNSTIPDAVYDTVNTLLQTNHDMEQYTKNDTEWLKLVKESYQSKYQRIVDHLGHSRG